MTTRLWTCPTCGARYTLGPPAKTGETKAGAAGPDQGSGITDAQRKAIYAISGKLDNGEERVKGMMQELYGLTSTSQLSRKQASELIDKLHKAVLSW